MQTDGTAGTIQRVWSKDSCQRAVFYLHRDGYGRPMAAGGTHGVARCPRRHGPEYSGLPPGCGCEPVRDPTFRARRQRVQRRTLVPRRTARRPGRSAALPRPASRPRDRALRGYAPAASGLPPGRADQASSRRAVSPGRRPQDRWLALGCLATAAAGCHLASCGRRWRRPPDSRRCGQRQAGVQQCRHPRRPHVTAPAGHRVFRHGKAAR